jgi:hypothetical protein
MVIHVSSVANLYCSIFSSSRCSILIRYSSTYNAVGNQINDIAMRNKEFVSIESISLGVENAVRFYFFVLIFVYDYDYFYIYLSSPYLIVFIVCWID